MVKTKDQTDRLPVQLRALRHRNYKLFISGQIISQMGYWMQSTALNWLVFPILTRDSSLLGLVGFAAQVPVLALGLFAGAVADSVNRHKLIIVMQTLLMMQAIILATLTFWRGGDGQLLINYHLVLVLATMAGVFQSFDIPARQAFLHQLVPKEDLQNAIALNSLAFNTARIIGPSIAAGIIGWLAVVRTDHIAFGEAVCFVINAISFLAVLISLFRIKVTARTVKPFHGSSAGFLAEGLRYVKRELHIRYLMMFAGVIALFGIPYVMLIQVFATDALHGSAGTFGRLMTCIGIGATVGGLLLAGRNKVHGLGRIIVGASAGFSITVFIFSWISNIWIACFLISIAGMCMVTTMISSMTLVQHLTSDHVRGRVMSLYNMVTTGLMPFGFLLSGVMAKMIGIRWAMTLNVAVCFTASIVFWTRLPALRRSARASVEREEARHQEHG